MSDINTVTLTGRITKDLELKKTQSNLSVVSFALAVGNRIKKQDGTYDSYFINCIAWRNNAEFITKYAMKGSLLAVSGELQSRSYENSNKQKVYVTEVVVQDVRLCSNPQKKEESAPYTEPAMDEEFIPGDDSYPFY